MARYQLTLSYDGTDFSGSQRQAKRRTVQGELEEALRRLGWSGRSILISGRTDTGVHATGQVAAFDLDWSHADVDLLRALNACLPPDMAVWDAREVDGKFHPRFDATSRRYRYRLFCQPFREPIRERFAWRISSEIDENVLANSAKIFPGTHDFSAFGSPTTPKGTTVRTVMRSEWMQIEKDGTWRYEIQADAFLYRMVRKLVFVQVAVAQGKVSAEIVSRSLTEPVSAGQRSEIPAGLAPAHGLTLVEVTYADKRPVESIGQ